MTEQEFLNEYSKLLSKLVDEFVEDIKSKLHLDCDILMDNNDQYLHTITNKANKLIAYLIHNHNLISEFKPAELLSDALDSYLYKISTSMQLQEYDRFKDSTDSLLEKCYA